MQRWQESRERQDRWEESIDCSILYQLPFWDGLILTAAALQSPLNSSRKIFGSGQKLRGITIRNPFLQPWLGGGRKI